MTKETKTSCCSSDQLPVDVWEKVLFGCFHPPDGEVSKKTFNRRRSRFTMQSAKLINREFCSVCHMIEKNFARTVILDRRSLFISHRTTFMYDLLKTVPKHVLESGRVETIRISDMPIPSDLDNYFSEKCPPHLKNVRHIEIINCKIYENFTSRQSIFDAFSKFFDNESLMMSMYTSSQQNSVTNELVLTHRFESGNLTCFR